MPDIDHLPLLRRLRDARTTAIAVVALLAVGGGAGAVAMKATRPSVVMAPIVPVAVRALSAGSLVTVRGRVVEIYGNRFVLADPTGRALVDTGREGEGGGLVTAGEAVTVQGRFDGGFVHAAFLIGPDNKVVALGPLGGPPHGPDDHRRGPEYDRGGPPPRPEAGTPAPPSAR